MSTENRLAVFPASLTKEQVAFLLQLMTVNDLRIPMPLCRIAAETQDALRDWQNYFDSLPAS